MLMTTNIAVAELALESLFTSASRVTLLRIFMLDPHRSYYQRQLAAATGLAIRAIQRELERLSAAGILYRHAEGNRAYYRVDQDCPLFPDLRNLVLKTAAPVDKLRGLLAADEEVLQVFLTADQRRALVVTRNKRRLTVRPPASMNLETMPGDEFTSRLAARDDALIPFLSEGSDLLGRRDNVIWRRIEAAGYTVRREQGVP